MSLKGSFSVPGDKSISHRVALFSLLAEGECIASNMSSAEDVQSSLRAAALLGAKIRRVGDRVNIVAAGGRIIDEAQVDCGNSGTTLRLLMGILAGIPGAFLLDGDASLRLRPMERVAAPLRRMGAMVECRSGTCPVQVMGGVLTGIDYELPVASAQLKSAVLLAGIQAEGATYVREPVPSRDHTERLLTAWGGRVSRHANRLEVRHSTLRMPESFTVPGDISSAAFFLCAAAIMPGSDVLAEEVLLNPTRSGFPDVLKRMGADIEISQAGESPEPWGSVRARFSPRLNACTIDAHEIPLLVDEAPVLALVATQAHGRTVFEGVGELRLKESDRLEAIASQLSLMGAQIAAHGDTLVVEGPTALKAPDRLDSYGDHRIAMTLRLAGLLAEANPLIDREESTAISYPQFHETLERLLRGGGGDIRGLGEASC